MMVRYLVVSGGSPPVGAIDFDGLDEIVYSTTDGNLMAAN